MKYLLFLLLFPAFAFAQPTLLQPTDFASPNKSGSATLDFPSTASGGYSELTMSVVGAADKDAVSLGVETAAVPLRFGVLFCMGKRRRYYYDPLL